MIENHKMEKLKAALDWYAEQAMKINAYVIANDTASLMAVMLRLAVDNG